MDQYQNLRGKLIMLDGPDNVGKTTQLDLLEKELKAAGLDVVRSRSSGGTPIGEMLRSVSFSDNERPPETDMHISLAQNYALKQEIEKWRAENKTIIIDRSPLSMLSYQVYGSGLDESIGLKATDEAMKIFSPDIIVAYSASLETLQKRAKQEDGSDYFGTKPAEYFNRVIRGYQNGAERYKEIVKVVDAEKDIDDIHQDTLHVLRNLK